MPGSDGERDRTAAGRSQAYGSRVRDQVPDRLYRRRSLFQDSVSGAQPDKMQGAVSPGAGHRRTLGRDADDEGRQICIMKLWKTYQIKKEYKKKKKE